MMTTMMIMHTVWRGGRNKRAKLPKKWDDKAIKMKLTAL